MKFLIVHDRPAVAEEIGELLKEFTKPGDTVDLAKDLQEARKHLAANIYDLLLVDLTIPFFAGKGKVPPDFSAVDKLLNELFSYDTLNIPGDVIGLTKDTSALGLVQNELGPHLMVAIEEDQGGKWKGYLRDKIDYACRASRTRSVLVNRYYDYDALILTAMDKEMAPYSEIFELTDFERFSGGKQFNYNDKHGQVRRAIAFSIGRSGQPSAASFAQALITFFRPKIALMSGYCGGMKGKAALGDLIFFEATYAWDYGKWKEEEREGKMDSVFVSRPSPINIVDSVAHRVARGFIQSDFNRQPWLVKRVQELSLGKLDNFAMYLRPVASGSAVVANDGIMGRITGLDDAINGVDMEAYGFYHAAKHTQVVKPEFLCVKAVSDYCNGEKNDDLHEACSYISAQAVAEILTGRWEF